MALEPRYEQLEALDIVGLPKNFTSETRAQIPQLWERFVKWIGHVPHQVGNETYGVIRNNDKGRGFYYLAGVAVSTRLAYPTTCDWYNCLLPGTPCSRMLVQSVSCSKRWCHLFRVGANASDELADSACFERYGEDFDPTTGLGTIEIWLPLVDAAETDQD